MTNTSATHNSRDANPKPGEPGYHDWLHLRLTTSETRLWEVTARFHSLGLTNLILDESDGLDLRLCVRVERGTTELEFIKIEVRRGSEELGSFTVNFETNQVGFRKLTAERMQEIRNIINNVQPDKIYTGLAEPAV